MKLVEEKKLKLGDEVFGKTGILKGEYGIPQYDKKPVKITVKQLLEHGVPGWGNSKRDPMSSGIASNDRKRFIRNALVLFPVDDPPGTKYEYSNFGYCVLGRVIEEASGMSYEEYVKKHILEPCRIDGMRIGGRISGADEVEYIGDNDNPYALSPLHMDAHGGWVANPIELVKLLVRVDGFSNVPDILSTRSIEIMTTPSAHNDHYALGWCVNRSNHWWHMGGMPGTTSMMARGSNGFNWAILINYRPNAAPAKDTFSGDMDRLFWRIREIVQEWHAGTNL
jgi:CubicO group peptidase (beta-lactamase class C family)